MFASEVPAIGKADPMKVISASRKTVQTTPGNTASLQAALDNIMASGASISDLEGAVTPRKGGKGKKKA
jgi:hypothetical protein